MYEHYVKYVFGDITIEPSSTDRIVFPDDGITKGDVIAYYADVASVMVPELTDRPLTLERFTKDIRKGGFYQKHAQKHYPPWIRRVTLRGKTPVDYPICDSPAALVYLANQGGFVLHVTTSRASTIMKPDLLVFDLDPPEGELVLVRKVARIIHDLFEQIGLPPFVKTTGSKGLHVCAPLDGTAAFDQVMALCAAMSGLLMTRHPDLVTTEFYKKDRKGRLFLDTMRNAPGSTVVAPYSLRGRNGAPVSAPIEWSELDSITPDGIRLRDVRARLDERGDPWAALRARPASITAAAQRLVQLAAS
jgi:bifunctional non-homologous end joining protein LigD